MNLNTDISSEDEDPLYKITRDVVASRGWGSIAQDDIATEVVRAHRAARTSREAGQ